MVLFFKMNIIYPLNRLAVGATFSRNLSRVFFRATFSVNSFSITEVEKTLTICRETWFQILFLLVGNSNPVSAPSMNLRKSFKPLLFEMWSSGHQYHLDTIRGLESHILLILTVVKKTLRSFSHRHLRNHPLRSLNLRF